MGMDLIVTGVGYADDDDDSSSEEEFSDIDGPLEVTWCAPRRPDTCTDPFWHYNAQLQACELGRELTRARRAAAVRAASTYDFPPSHRIWRSWREASRVEPETDADTDTDSDCKKTIEDTLTACDASLLSYFWYWVNDSKSATHCASMLRQAHADDPERIEMAEWLEHWARLGARFELSC